ncbi:MAG: FISUMP domain-containing protein, partial [Flavobacteriales bacterium]
LALYSCKKDNPPEEEPTEETFQFGDTDVYESISLVDAAVLMFPDLANTNTGDYREDASSSLLALSQWLNDREEIESTDIVESTYLNINFTSGLKHTIWLNYVDQDGTSLYRGSRPVNQTFQHINQNGGPCENVIDNNKILHWRAATDIAFDGSYNIEQYIENSPIGFEIDYLSGSECDLQSFRSFGEYSMVFIDTHGFPEGTMLGSKYNVELEALNAPIDVFVNSIVEQLGLATYQEIRRGGVSLAYPLNIRNSSDWYDVDFANGQVALQTREYSTRVEANFISQSPALSNTILLNNSCNSGWTTVTEHVQTPVANSYLSLNPIAYFGYRKADGTSQPIVDSLGCSATRDIAKRVADQDSTGQWYLRPNGIQYINPLIPNVFDPPAYLSLFESPSHCYEDPCGTFIDGRDEREYETACIGGKTWMAENLRWSGAGQCFENDLVNCQNIGRLYSIEELTNLQEGSDESPVQGLCPNGWHVPTLLEYQQMYIAINDGAAGVDFYEYAAQSLATVETGFWEEGSNATNITGMNIKPNGYGYLNVLTNDQQWVDYFSPGSWQKEAVFWTSSLRNDPNGNHDFSTVILKQYDNGSLKMLAGS